MKQIFFFITENWQRTGLIKEQAYQHIRHFRVERKHYL